jgi:hypothetical protein
VGWYKFVETASKKKVFTVFRKKGKEFISAAEVQQKLVFHSITTKGENVQSQ